MCPVMRPLAGAARCMFPVSFSPQGSVPCVTAEEVSCAVLSHGLGRSPPTECSSILPPGIFVLAADSKSVSLPLALSAHGFFFLLSWPNYFVTLLLKGAVPG